MGGGECGVRNAELQWKVDRRSTLVRTFRTPHSAFRTGKGTVSLLESIVGPADIRRLGRDQLQPLADEVRRRLIDVVSQTGGHIRAGLGVGAVTAALGYCFDSPRDKIVWDVGHQGYPWKIPHRRHQRPATPLQPG